MKHLTLDQKIGLFGAALTLITAIIAFAIPQGGLTVSLSIVLVALVVWLGYLENENRRCIIARNFKQYCVKCRRMLNKSGRHGTVMTIQTPIRDIPADAREAFTSYMDRTFEILISTQCQYNRLVLLEPDDSTPENRIKEFVQQLIDKAKESERSPHGNTDFDLHNVHIGFVTLDSVQDSIYTNMDIHCTTDKDFSIAFMGKQAQQGRDFGSSLHLHDSKTTVSKLVQGAFRAAWAQADIITVGTYYPNYDGVPASQKTDAQIETIRSGIIKQIEERVNILKSRRCPDPARVGPDTFTKQLKVQNPALFLALRQRFAQP